MTNLASIFEASAKEVLERLRGDYSLEAARIRDETWAIIDLLRACSDLPLVPAAVISRLFSLYRRAMSYLIDRRNKFWQYLPRPELNQQRKG